MSRLHTLRASTADLALTFGIDAPAPVPIPDETVEGAPGLVVIERDGRRLLKAMSWGFPRPTLRAAIRNEPPSRVGLVADLTNPMWSDLVQDPRYRCLIPITHFGNPDGEPGAKTRTWFSVADLAVVAWAGFCRNTPEFGPVYAA